MKGEYISIFHLVLRSLENNMKLQCITTLAFCTSVYLNLQKESPFCHSQSHDKMFVKVARSVSVAAKLMPAT